MENDIPELALFRWHQLTAVVTATTIPRSVSGPTHTLYPNLLPTSSAFTKLKPHPNCLHLLTCKLDAQEPRFSFRLPPPFVGCAHEDWHLCSHQWNTGVGPTPVCAPLQQPAGSHLRQQRGQELLSIGKLQLPPSVIRGGRSTGVPQLQSLFCKCHRFTVWLGKVTMPCFIAVSSSSKSGRQHVSPIRHIINSSTGLTLLLLCNSKQET